MLLQGKDVKRHNRVYGITSTAGTVNLIDSVTVLSSLLLLRKNDPVVSVRMEVK